MNLNVKRIATTTALGVAIVAGTLGTPTPAKATHYIGHAIIGGVIGGVIGSAIVNSRRQPVYVAPPPVYAGFSQQHYNWCFNQYRSYHQPSNTFQPYNGPRRPCVSPW